MKIKLKNISSIQTGLFAKPVATGEIVYIQARHFDENGRLNSKLYPDLPFNNNIQKHLLMPGDILFAAKGTKNFAALYESKNLPAVASTSFFIIRLNSDAINKIIPEFLMWFFNHHTIQKLLKGKAIGTNMVSISKSVLEDLEISIPDLQTQKYILEIIHLREREKSLTKRIETLKEIVIQQQILNKIK